MFQMYVLYNDHETKPIGGRVKLHNKHITATTILYYNRRKQSMNVSKKSKINQLKSKSIDKITGTI